MAKSSKKQCRKPKPPRQGGALVVVSARNLQSKPNNIPAAQAAGNKKGKRKKKGLLLGDIMASRVDAESDDFGAASPSSPSHPSMLGSGGVPEYLFSSTHSRQQRLYYLLATRPRSNAEVTPSQDVGAASEEGGCHSLVFVETVATAQELIAELKALSLLAFAVHERTPKAQAQEHAKRFLAAPSADRSSVLVLTNAAVSRSPSVGTVPTTKGSFVRIVHFDAPEGPKNLTARERIAASVLGERGAGAAEEVHLEGTGDAAGLAPFAFESGAMGGIRSRLAVAKKLARAVTMSAGEGEERGMQRAAAAAGLEWDEEGGQGESASEALKREKQRAHTQQAAALRQRVSVLLCQPLLAPTATLGSTTATTPNVMQSSKELRKKMAVLGMIHGPQGPDAGTKRRPEDRALAQTRWLDGSAGKLFGGSWDGSIRIGASCDSSSLDMRSQVETAKKGASRASNREANGTKGGSRYVASALAEWKPNPNTPDSEKWGGQWGKPCGHNEVVLQHLRPFAPMEVINTRVCSMASPAPGNAGFDGCLELLSLTCRAHKRALTVWDDASFLYVDKAGVCSSLRKQAMLHLPLPTLRFLAKNMRSFTVCCEGQKPPREVAQAVIRSAVWGAKQSKFGPLSAELSTRVMSFVLSGDLAAWRSLSAGFGVVRARQATSNERKEQETIAFASKKKRKNFNL